MADTNTTKSILVKEGDTLPCLAAANGYNDGGKALWEKNKPAIGENMMVLPVGLALQLPEQEKKNAPGAATRKNNFVVPTKKFDLHITLQRPNGTPLNSGADYFRFNYEFKANGRIYTDLTIEKIGKGILIKGIDASVSAAELKVKYTLIQGDSTPNEQTIKLHIGSLEPIIDPKSIPQKGYNAVRAILKLLTNMGCYTGDVNKTEWDSACRAAVRAFQANTKQPKLTGLLDQALCDALVKAQENKMPPAKAPAVKPDPGAAARDEAYKGGGEGEPKTTPIRQSFLDPTDKKQGKHSRKRLQLPLMLPAEAYVALCEPGKESVNPNVIRMSQGRYIYLDCGKWKEGQGGGFETDLGVIWGRHTYLCRYEPDGMPGQAAQACGPRLDETFFKAMGSRLVIEKRASAFWAPDEDFDWDKIYVVIPDMHLMNAQVGTNWCLSDYTLEAEMRLWEFTKALLAIEDLRANLVTVQIGDSYDLWVGCGRGADRNEAFFFDNIQGKMRIYKAERESGYPHLLPMIQDIRGQDWVAAALKKNSRFKKHKPEDFQRGSRWHTPAEAAFLLLNEALGADDGGRSGGSRMLYIYGNHDNYLIDDALCAAAGIPYRRRYYDRKGLLIEHGHRLEASFDEDDSVGAGNYSRIKSIPINSDGYAESAFEATCDVYNALAKPNAEAHFGMSTTPSTGFFNGVGNFIGQNATAVGNTVGNAVNDGKKYVNKKVIGGADKYAEWHDHDEYLREFAQIWCGRKAGMKPAAQFDHPDEGKEFKPFHITTMGHTHIKELWVVDFDPLDTNRVHRPTQYVGKNDGKNIE